MDPSRTLDHLLRFKSFSWSYCLSYTRSPVQSRRRCWSRPRPPLLLAGQRCHSLGCWSWSSFVQFQCLDLPGFDRKDSNSVRCLLRCGCCWLVSADCFSRCGHQCDRLELCRAQLRQQLAFRLVERRLLPQEVRACFSFRHQRQLLPHGCMDLLGTNSNSSYWSFHLGNYLNLRGFH